MEITRGVYVHIDFDALFQALSNNLGIAVDGTCTEPTIRRDPGVWFISRTEKGILYVDRAVQFKIENVVGQGSRKDTHTQYAIREEYLNDHLNVLDKAPVPLPNMAKQFRDKGSIKVKHFRHNDAYGITKEDAYATLEWHCQRDEFLE